MSNKNKFAGLIHRNFDIIILPLAFIIVAVSLSILNPGDFLTGHNMSAIAFQIPELGLFSFAMMISMVTGGINLSIISTANLSGVVMALMMTRLLPPGAGGAVLWAGICGVIAAGLLISAILGLLNGILIAYVEVSPVLTTIGTMIFFEGLTLSITKGYVVSGCPDGFVALGNGKLAGIPVPMIIFVVAVLFLWLIFRGKPFGRYLFLIGSNIKAVEYSGVNVRLVLVKAYVLSSLYAGVAAVIMLARLNSANARYGVSYMLLSVLISVLGGTDPNGGFGRISGIIMALLTLQFLTSGFNLMGVSSFITVALWGVLLLLIILYRRTALNRRNVWMSKQAAKNSKK